MAVWIQPSSTTNRIVTTTLLGVAQITTFVRLSIRIRAKRFWFDDAWAILALIFSCILLVDMWIRTDLTRSKSTRIIAYWMICVSFTSTLWASRMAVIFSVLRITPPQLPLRKITAFFTVLFGLMWIALLIQKVYKCASDKSWYALQKPQCHLGTGVAAMELFTDFTADLVLAAIPFELLRSVRTMASSQRKLVIIIFATSLLTTAVSVVHAVYLLGPTGLLEGITAQAEAAVSLLVANAAVIVPSVYRLVQTQATEEVYDYSINTAGAVRANKRIPLQNVGLTESTAIVFKNPGLLTTFGTLKPEATLN